MSYEYKGRDNIDSRESEEAHTVAKFEYFRAAEASIDAGPSVAPKHGTFDPSKCGTYAGYRQHERYDVPKCLPCKAQKSIRDTAAYARRVGIAA